MNADVNQFGARDVRPALSRRWGDYAFASYGDWCAHDQLTLMHDCSHATVLVLLTGCRSMQIVGDGASATVLAPVPGDIFLLPLQQRTSIRFGGRFPELVELHLPIDASGLGSFAEDGQYGFRDDFIWHCANRISQLSAAPTPATDAFCSNLLQALGAYLAVHVEHGKRARTVKPLEPFAMKERVDNFLRENLSKRIVLADIAEALELEPGKLQVAFQNQFDITPIQYLISLRVAKAKELLASSAMEISEIAMATGFCNHPHLCRTFKNRMNISPRDYRKRFGVAGRKVAA